MDPKISIIIPVYNVEQYLAECLDSVINQTLREIQIICVNDGSPDNSRSILQEYADRDSRIEIIDKPNGGLSSARNAAFSYIRGKYTLYVDSDDWIELDLCEKTYQKAEATNADMVFFFFFTQMNTLNSRFQSICIGDKSSLEERFSLIYFDSAWSKLFRTDFFRLYNIEFPDGLVYEDVPVCWKTVLYAKKISIIPERLYHYRSRTSSITHSVGEHSLHHIPIFNFVRDFLKESGYYDIDICRTHFFCSKLNICFRQHLILPSPLKYRFAAMLRESLSDDERNFCRTASDEQLAKTVRLFYVMLDGGWRDVLKYRFARFSDIVGPYIVRVPGARFTVRKIVRPVLKRMMR